MGKAMIVGDGKGRATMVFGSDVTLEMAINAISRTARYHELMLEVRKRGSKESHTDKVAVTLQSGKKIPGLSTMALEQFKSIARAMGNIDLSEDKKILETLCRAFPSPSHA